jgi:hypothetical protein
MASNGKHKCAKRLRKRISASLWRKMQGCQIFLGAIYQNVKYICTKTQQNIPNGHITYQIISKLTEWR